jgi:MFS family permease
MSPRRAATRSATRYNGQGPARRAARVRASAQQGETVSRDLDNHPLTPDHRSDRPLKSKLAAPRVRLRAVGPLTAAEPAPSRGRLEALGEGISRALINRNYALFMAGSFVSATGTWAQAVAIGWLVLDLGNSTFLLGLANFASMVPLLILGFPAGAIVDRFDRRKLLFVGQGGTMVVVILLAASALLGFINIPLILALALAGGVFNAISWPTWSVFIKDLVGPEHLRAAVAMNSARFNLTRVFGPAVAGLILAQYGAGACLAVAAVSSCGVTLALLAIRVPTPSLGPARDWVTSLREGIEYAYRHHAVRSLLITTGVVGFLVLPLQSFLPAYARDVLGRGPETLGILLTAIGVGAIGGAALSGGRLAARRPVAVMAALTLVTGAAMIGLALSQRIEVALFALAVIGATSIGYLSIANATIQLATREDIIGRIMGLWTVVNAGVTPIGSLAIGAAAERTGLPPTFAVAGVGCTLLGIVMLFLARRIRGSTGGATL